MRYRKGSFTTRNTITLCCALVITAGAVSAQVRNGVREKQKQSAEKSDAAAMRRQRAASLLTEAADSARNLDNLFYRARIEASVADAFWTVDPARSVSMFERAWLSAIASDKADTEDHLNETGQALPDDIAYSEARNEVLRLAAHRDPTLAERFLKDMTSSSPTNSDHTDEPSNANPWGNLSPAGARTLELAANLLADGDVAGAARIASPVLREGPNAQIVSFILAVNERDAAAASSLYGQLLSFSVKDPRANLNTVLLLSAPVVSPFLITTVDAAGSLQFRSVSNSAKTTAISGGARRGFYDAALTILSRQPINSGDTGTLAAQYFVLSRLLPFYEQEAPELAVNLKGRMDIVSRNLDGNRRANLEAQSNTLRVSDEKAGDPLRFQAEQLSHAPDSASRDQLAIALIRSAIRNELWERAARAASVISEPSLRSAAENLITISKIAAISEAFSDPKDDEYDGLLAFLSKSGAQPFALSYGYSQIAVIAARRDEKPRAMELLNEAERYAGALTPGSKTHIAALSYLSTTMARFDEKQAARLLRETVKSINASEDYLGDEESLSLNDDGGEAAPLGEITIDGAPFRISAVFATMARLNFDETVIEARAIKPEIPRLLALVAVAGTGLEKATSKPARAARPAIRT